RAAFFSLNTCMEMVAPYIKKVADHCHEKGLLFHQHSCGKNEALVPAMIWAGVDLWIPQVMNDVKMLTEKYGDQIMFAYTPEIPQNASEEELVEAAKQLVADFACGFPEKPVMFSLRGAPRIYAETVYSESRKALL
ncbi:MAG: methyltransferase, partial [Lachnospiraceae bacterium]|nr:methyltransferase [Lachnospiraceae bacterium]